MKREYFCKEQIALLDFIPKALSEEGIFIEPDKIESYIDYCERYFFKLMPFQKFRGAFIDGVFEKRGLPLFNKHFTLGGRGLGKTGEYACISGYLTSNRHGVKRYHVDIIANSEDQAKLTFDDVYDTILDRKELEKNYYVTKEIITFKKTNSSIRYRSSNGKTADGGRPGAILFDEIHAMENYSNISVNESGLGKVKNPRIFYYSTDGYVRGAVLDDTKEKARRILAGERYHYGFLPLIFKLDNAKEVQDKKKWIKANPRIEHSPELERTIEDAYIDALETPSRMAEFMTKRMNLPQSGDGEPVATWDEIKATNQEMPDLTGQPCVAAIDFSLISDFTSVGLVFRSETKVYVMHHTFIHESSILNTKYNIPIDEAVRKGYATIIKENEHKTIPPKIIAEWVLEKAQTYQIRKVVADRFRITYLREEFNKMGVPIEEVGNGTISHNILHPIVSKLFKEENVVYGDDLLMRWYTNNVFVDTDRKGNRSYKKIEPIKRKTDGFFMFLHALIALFKEEAPTEEYEAPVIYY